MHTVIEFCFIIALALNFPWLFSSPTFGAAIGVGKFSSPLLGIFREILVQLHEIVPLSGRAPIELLCEFVRCLRQAILINGLSRHCTMLTSDRVNLNKLLDRLELMRQSAEACNE